MTTKQLKNKFLEVFYSKNYPKEFEKAYLRQCFLKGSIPPVVLYGILVDERIHWVFDGKDIHLSAANQLA